jgi:hypothetical protein
MRSMLRKRAPIGGDHHDVARSFLDAWLGELEFATFHRLREDRPDLSSDELDLLSEVSDHDDGRWIWVAIEGSLMFVVEKRTGLIFEVNGLGSQQAEMLRSVAVLGLELAEVPYVLIHLSPPMANAADIPADSRVPKKPVANEGTAESERVRSLAPSRQQRIRQMVRLLADQSRTAEGVRLSPSVCSFPCDLEKMTHISVAGGRWRRANEPSQRRRGLHAFFFRSHRFGTATTCDSPISAEPGHVYAASCRWPWTTRRGAAHQLRPI